MRLAALNLDRLDQVSLSIQTTVPNDAQCRQVNHETKMCANKWEYSLVLGIYTV